MDRLLALSAPPLTWVNPLHRPLALSVMGLRNRVPPDAQPARARGASRRWPDGYERLLRRLLTADDDGPALIDEAARPMIVAGLWALLADLPDRRQAELLALTYGLDQEPTRAITMERAAALYNLSRDQGRRLCLTAEASLATNQRMAELRQHVTAGD